MPTRGRLRRVFQKGLWAQLRTSPHQQQIHLKVRESISLKGQAQGNRREFNSAYLAPLASASRPIPYFWIPPPTPPPLSVYGTEPPFCPGCSFLVVGGGSETPSPYPSIQVRYLPPPIPAGQLDLFLSWPSCSINNLMLLSLDIASGEPGTAGQPASGMPVPCDSGPCTPSEVCAGRVCT
jgi:hypothetical protein